MYLQEEIVTYEVAKLAKEKGFDVPTDRYYHIYDDVIEAQNSLEMTGNGCADFYNSLNRSRCAAPTQSLLQRWLREEKGVIIELKYSDITEDWRPFWSWCIYNNLGFALEIGDNSSTYELTLEDALKYALEHLVL